MEVVVVLNALTDADNGLDCSVVDELLAGALELVTVAVATTWDTVWVMVWVEMDVVDSKVVSSAPTRAKGVATKRRMLRRLFERMMLLDLMA